MLSHVTGASVTRASMESFLPEVQKNEPCWVSLPAARAGRGEQSNGTSVVPKPQIPDEHTSEEDI